jgi:hypothetical protein
MDISFLDLGVPYVGMDFGISAALSLVMLVASTVLQIVLAPRPPKPKPAALSDFEVPTAEEGRPIPVVFGTVMIKGPNVVWYGDLRSAAIKKKGGKK